MKRALVNLQSTMLNATRYNYKTKRNKITAVSIENALRLIKEPNFKISTANNFQMEKICTIAKIRNCKENRIIINNIWRKKLKNKNMSTEDYQTIPSQSSNEQSLPTDDTTNNTECLISSVIPIINEPHPVYLNNCTNELETIYMFDDTNLSLENNLENGEISENTMAECLIEFNTFEKNDNSLNNQPIVKDNIKIIQNKKISRGNKFRQLNYKLNLSSDVWDQIFLPKEKKFNSYTYTSIISDQLTKQSGCQINIKGYDISNRHVTIRAYCGHKSKNVTCRQYKLVNKELTTGNFSVFSTNGPIVHPYKKFRQASKFSRAIYKKKLISNSAEIVGEMLIAEEDADFVIKNNTIQTAKTNDVLRKMRSEALKSQDNTSNDFTDISEEMMKYDEENQYIQKIGYRPFLRKRNIKNDAGNQN